MLSIRASGLRALIPIPVALPMHPIMIQAIATEEQALQLAAAFCLLLLVTITGSAPVFQRVRLTPQEPPPALTV